MNLVRNWWVNFIRNWWVNLVQNIHLANHKGFTGKAKDWMVVHLEAFGTKRDAFARERFIKAQKKHHSRQIPITPGLNFEGVAH